MNPLVLLLIVVAVAAFGGAGVAVAKGRASEYDSLFRAYANDPRLAKAVALVESSLNPNASGDDGRAFGLMQIWYSTAKGHGYQGPPVGLYDPATNVYYATRELNHLVSRYGFERGIMGYNIGETRLRKGGSNTAYLNKVLDRYRRYTV